MIRAASEFVQKCRTVGQLRSKVESWPSPHARGWLAPGFGLASWPQQRNIRCGVPTEQARSDLCSAFTRVLGMSVLNLGIALTDTGFQTERIKLEFSCFTCLTQATPHYLLSYFCRSCSLASFWTSATPKSRTATNGRRKKIWTGTGVPYSAFNQISSYCSQYRQKLSNGFFLLPPVH